MLCLWVQILCLLVSWCHCYPWCWPKLWEGKRWTLQITHTDQGPDVWESTSEMSVDVLGERLALNETGVRDGSHYTVFYLYYYPLKTVYKVQDGVCTTSPTQGNISNACVDVPSDLVKEYLNERLGGDYPEWLWTFGARWTKDGVGRFLDVVQTFIPLLDEMHGVINGVPTYTVSNYYDVTPGIRDPAIFTPPNECVKVNPFN